MGGGEGGGYCAIAKENAFIPAILKKTVHPHVQLILTAEINVNASAKNIYWPHVYSIHPPKNNATVAD